MRIMGIIALMAIVATGALLMAGKDAAVVEEQQPVLTQVTNVKVAPAQRVMFERVLTVQGNVQAKNLALISPRVFGHVG